MNIGQKVRVRRLRDRSNKDVIDHLGKIGVIEDYRMTDGSGVGVIVKFDDKFAAWYFEDEVETVG